MEEKLGQDGARETLGVMCVNVGTPSSYRRGDVRRYLQQFLRDPRVIQPWWVRLIVGYLVPYLRAPYSARRYRSIWRTTHDSEASNMGSPLLFHGRALASKLEVQLNSEKDSSSAGWGYKVVVAMSYGAPSISAALADLARNSASTVIILPLFPHYAISSFGTAVAQIYLQASRSYVVPRLRVMDPYYDHPRFLALEARRLQKYLQRYKHHHVVMSYHGIPLSQCQGARVHPSQHPPCGAPDYKCCHLPAAAAANCYRWQCIRTSQGIAVQAGLSNEHYTTTFQSRLGPAAWTAPNTLEVLKKLCQDSQLQAIIVLFPSFISDGLETLEEIALEAREMVMKLRSNITFITVPCGNSSQDLVNFFADEVQHLAGFKRRSLCEASAACKIPKESHAPAST